MVFTTKEENVLRAMVNAKVLEMELESIRDAENSKTTALQNLISDARTAIKTECVKK